MQQIVKSTQFNPTNCFYQQHPNENSLIVENKFNPISHSCPVHHGTFFNVLIDKFCSCKAQRINHLCTQFILKETKQEQHFVVFFSSKYIFLLRKRLDIC